MRRRKLVGPLLAVAVITVGALASTVPPAGAQQARRPDVVLTGNFSGGPEGEAFFYRAGAGSDYLVRFSTGGTLDGTLTWQVFPYAVTGTYRPVAGDFDADGYDEILWYAPGSAPDALWDFTSDTARTSRSLSISGTYRPVAGDFDGDGYDDVFWYGLAGRDYVWFHRAGGYDNVEYAISYATFRPVAGSFGADSTDDVFFHAPGSAPDYLWDFHPDRSRVSTGYAVAGEYQVLSLDMFGQDFGGEDIWFYDEDSSNSSIWDFAAGQRARVIPAGFFIDYTAAAGNLFGGDRCDDIVAAETTSVVLWNFYCVDTRFRNMSIPDLHAPSEATTALEPAQVQTLTPQD